MPFIIEKESTASQPATEVSTTGASTTRGSANRSHSSYVVTLTFNVNSTRGERPADDSTRGGRPADVSTLSRQAYIDTLTPEDRRIYYQMAASFPQ
ncbi:uncharacterized protein L203_105664 [Cryptococcus depauperatus CBS 7841]|uniref:Uncharacterized protein n=1 Tax=Cryptococcus depauperatus CBS 7841 TaxID=1295531 RepID=A0A1E3IFG4_9TREE|nr:hypothetical protein L203_03540 [Cryptococcus depauperatus CBS 7841]